MLEFTQVFSRGTIVYKSDITTIMRCKNIDFSHVFWDGRIFNKSPVVYHIIDNVVDVNIFEHTYGANNCYALMDNIVRHYSTSNPNEVVSRINHVANNGHISNSTFRFVTNLHDNLVPMINKFRGLVKYLTDTSLNRFTKFYNLDKYYDMVITMLLILKTQQRLPSAIIKHLIIPFIYQ